MAVGPFWTFFAVSCFGRLLFVSIYSHHRHCLSRGFVPWRNSGGPRCPCSHFQDLWCSDQAWRRLHLGCPTATCQHVEAMRHQCMHRRLPVGAFCRHPHTGCAAPAVVHVIQITGNVASFAFRTGGKPGFAWTPGLILSFHRNLHGGRGCWMHEPPGKWMEDVGCLEVRGVDWH